MDEPNLLYPAKNYLCSCRDDNLCTHDQVFRCEDCGLQTTMKCNHCLNCNPDHEHPDAVNTTCYGCGISCTCYHYDDWTGEETYYPDMCPVHHKECA